MAARSIWNGALTIAGVNVPVKVFSATESHTPHFRELHEKDGAPIEHKRVSSKTGREVAYDNIVKGYETSSGRYVVLTDEEIKAIEAPERRAIEVDDFVPAEQIDPGLLRPRLLPRRAGRGPRRLRGAAARRSTRRGSSASAASCCAARSSSWRVRPGDGCMRMSTMRFADELVDVEGPRHRRSREEADQARDRHGREADRGPGEEVRPVRVQGHVAQDASRTTRRRRRRARSPSCPSPRPRRSPTTCSPRWRRA